MMRLPPKRILAAVDFSAVSLHAWKAARRIAERFGSELEAVYCEPADAEAAAFGTPRDGLARRAELEALLRARVGPDARLHLLQGEAAPLVVSLARRGRYDLVVVGTHRRRGVARLLAGSVAEAVARSCCCPVLVVPRPMRGPRVVLAPVHAARYARRGLAAAAVVARAYKAGLAVLNVSEDPIFDPAPERVVRRSIDELPGALRRQVRPVAEAGSGEAVEGILKACRGKDLIVLSAHRHGALKDWTLGTTVERVIRRSPIPVLTIPERVRRRPPREEEP